ncbi:MULTISPECIES: WbqC family protein [Legionella]|mgnify:CR=1 FL=1|uniref:WbqC-like protein family protein n=1 Tax=Legionella steelei TaxID=947033 RepID=A0A0W0ZK84_9GAMM|nr:MULTISPECIES: WbqC family protein [Legionella]KTD69637.1 WbqC-like protein family protein [Legionella steelei]MBN9227188.1 WbqC family protein [Legionella steelei]OJW07251.1 MAG: hypothetical protein BGO44_16640 [Legionella sp. 39-23]
MKKIAILQSNYIPWKGYFDMIASVDEFILYDDMQFTKNDWRNRNKIKTTNGVDWISVPVGQNINRRIRDVELREDGWQKKHWKTLEYNYRRAPKYQEISSFLEPFYQKHYTHLSVLNRQLIEAICDYLGITTKITNSWDYTLIDGKTERLVDLCLQAGANEYLSGPAAFDYINAQLFADQGIKLSWFDYKGYPEYPQLWGEFTHEVSILDLLFNCGKDSVNYLRYVKK